MLIFGIVLFVVGWMLGLGILMTLGVILAVVGAVLLVLSSVGRTGGRYFY